MFPEMVNIFQNQKYPFHKSPNNNNGSPGIVTNVVTTFEGENLKRTNYVTQGLIFSQSFWFHLTPILVWNEVMYRTIW